MAKISHPRDLLAKVLKDLYSAENQFIKGLPKLIKAATSESLTKAFEECLQQTQEHVDRLMKIGEQLVQPMKGKKCKAMEGLVKETAELMEEKAEPAMLDLALVGAVQKIEHYKIAGYGTAHSLAELAGEKETADALKKTLNEELETDQLFAALATQLGTSEDPAESAATSDTEESEGQENVIHGEEMSEQEEIPDREHVIDTAEEHSDNVAEETLPAETQTANAEQKEFF